MSIATCEAACPQLSLAMPELPSWRDPALVDRLGVIEVKAATILSRSRVPGMDLGINPYGGCAFACSYCYATFMGRRLGRRDEDWGRWVYVKRNLPTLLERELGRGRSRDKAIMISSVTDPYQGVERRYRLTRTALELLVRHGHRGRVMIMTKAPLVTRDIDLLGQLDADVGISLTTAHDALSRVFEGRAPPIHARLEALASLNAAGLRTFVFLGPLFPHLVDQPEQLDDLFAAVRAAGTKRALLAHFNLRSAVRERVIAEVAPEHPELVERYYRKPARGSKARLGKLALEGARRHGLELQHPTVIDHY
jgi:DNA repair photolyase